jgi:hypothetical protein
MLFKGNDGDKESNIFMRHLEEKGWDVIQGRMYLGFSSRRIEWSYECKKED